MKFQEEKSITNEHCNTKMYPFDFEHKVSPQKEIYPSLIFDLDHLNAQNSSDLEDTSSIFNFFTEEDKEFVYVPKKVSSETNMSDFMSISSDNKIHGEDFQNKEKDQGYKPLDPASQEIFGKSLGGGSDDHHHASHNHHGSEDSLNQSVPGRLGCRCGKSKCVRLHCRCFRDLEYCATFCKCVDCLNTIKHKTARDFIIQKTKEINQKAFVSKFSVIPSNNKKSLYVEGCLCKTGCNRKYCECFKNGTGCSPLCKCSDCLNTILSIPKEELSSLTTHIVRKKNRIVIKNLEESGNEDVSESKVPQKEDTDLSKRDTENYSSYSLPIDSLQPTKGTFFIQYENYKKVKIDSKPL